MSNLLYRVVGDIAGVALAKYGVRKGTAELTYHMAYINSAMHVQGALYVDGRNRAFMYSRVYKEGN